MSNTRSAHTIDCCRAFGEGCLCRLSKRAISQERGTACPNNWILNAPGWRNSRKEIGDRVAALGEKNRVEDGVAKADATVRKHVDS
jgi:hypothetical protein